MSEQVVYGPWGEARRGEDWSTPLTQGELEALDIGYTGHQPELEDPTFAIKVWSSD